MPLGLRLPVFVRSKTAYGTTSSEVESRPTTAADLSSPSLSDLKKSTSVLNKRRGRSKVSSDRVVSSHDKSTSPPATTTTTTTTTPAIGFGVDSALLGSVGEDKEEIDGPGNDAMIDKTAAPILRVQEATPTTTETELPTRQTLARSPLSTSTQHEPTRPRSSDGLSTQGSIARKSSNASPKHVSPSPSLVDSANATLMHHHKPKMPRKIWVKRPGASATLVQVREDDLVDDVRDMILRKYANSLGRTFDAPDMTLRIVALSEILAARTDRTLGPEEEICSTLDMAYPGGQTIQEALVIDVPVKRTPRPSPRVYQQYTNMEDARPVESGSDYFPPMPALQPVMPTSVHANYANQQHHQVPLTTQEHQRSMSVLTTGQLPPLPSPGSTRKYREHRPKIGRTNTSSPTSVQHNSSAGMPLSSIPANMMMHRAPTRPRVDSSTSDSTHLTINGIPPAPPPPPPPALPTPPALEAPTAPRLPGSTPPTPSTAAALLNDNRPLRPKRNRKPTPTSEKGSGRLRGPRRGSHDAPTRLGLPVSNMLEGIVPPINILIVEDNSITRRVLEGLMKRLRVRWDTAINGQIAVDKWRKGGYHLILMDIQMPVMNGLQATKEIRRLEKVNGIGVFSSSTPSSPDERRGGQKDPNTDGVELDGESSTTETTKRDPAVDKIVITESIFKSPIIIVALTASALQSDRHEALAAGCNDFLTKPVHLPWLERKVKEWGCMQALIDFDGWKRWRDINEKEEANKSNEQKAKEREQDEKHNKGMERLEQLQEQKAGDDKRKAANRASIDGSAAVNGFAHSNGGH